MTIDVRKRFRELYAAPTDRFVEMEVPERTYLAIDGSGDPNTAPGYARAVEALYTSAYAVRAALKKRSGDAFAVGPLEGLWSSEDPADFVTGTKAKWDWTMLVPLPAEVSGTDAEIGLDTATAKKPDLPAARLLTLTEGPCLQILHVGSYDDEAPTLARLHAEVMPERRLTWNGPHHEIYLSDPRRTPPEDLKTILRQPVRAS
ncbi:GyrI-like domain-containing protein [Microbacterium sp. 179-B 1A2 NHS]|uniref:GyrI-like domain-containing protein n=1 Tax=Microbacterium sp. 179-B 1A2 NHS TaxID=3142383 RepID=UPI0039A18635